ncbi:HAD family hydrolase [Lacticaseibacillus zhaodongensis]|uniref:Cof-type HAD-IIB family hydrolase n=1 Tax=Lacticaseibacillus zhaodongensis TaxID=2668065 RepID=UPI0018AF9AAA|nr:HAD family hydrolase [Lacticaseibacillus zhaodongensis]
MSPYTIFMDIDNTLIGHSQYPSQRVVKTIAKYRAQGHRFFIASGRPLFSAIKMAARIGPDLDIICANGTVTRINGQVRAQHLSTNALEGIWRVAKKYQLAQYFFTLDKILDLAPLPAAASDDGKHRVAGVDPANYIDITSLEQLRAKAAKITNAIAMDQDLEKVARARVEMNQLSDIDASSSYYDNIEITAHGINKATAILRVCHELNQPLGRTMAFGDGSNDLQMLKTVHYGVAMGNANQEVKAATKFHTLDIDHDGVAVALDKFLGGTAQA